MNEWKLIIPPAVETDLDSFDRGVRDQILKALSRVRKNPLPASEGGYGKPLGNKGGINLTGCLKIKLLRLGIRIVYLLKRMEYSMQLVVISVRADSEVYRTAAERLKNMP